MDVLIVNYNTQELTEAAIRSLNKVTPRCHVYVFDNSDGRPFDTTIPNVEIIDNTRGQEVDFASFLSAFPRKQENRSSWGSAKHCISVDRCFDILQDGFLLMDSDILLTRDVRLLFDANSAWTGGIQCNTLRFGWEIRRVMPFLCYVNVPMLTEYGVRYFNGEKMWFLSDDAPNMYYDTGAWLLEESDRLELPRRIIDINDYAVHLGHGSWRDKDAAAWIKEHERLWI